MNVPSVPAGTKTIYMYYGNSGATSLSNGNSVFEFFDDFSGTTLNTGKWTVNAVNSISYTVNGYFRFTDATKSEGTYWIYGNSNSGSQHQAIWTPLSSFIVEWRSTISDTSSNQMGEGSVAIVGSDNLITAYITHTDSQGASLIPSYGYIFVEATTGSGASVSNGDIRDFKYVISGSTITIYQKPASSDSWTQVATATSSSVSKIALAAGAYGGYPFLNYIQIDNVRARKYASTEPSASIGTEEAP